MKFKLRKLFFLFIFLLIFYAIYFLFMNQSFAKLHKFNYEPVNYKNFGQMNRLRKQYEVLNKIKNEKLVLNKLKSNKQLYKEIDCIINGEYNINCLRSVLDQNVYMPFIPFIRDYFGVYGKLDSQVFHFEHSYSKIYTPNDKYDYRSKFLWFENYAVENRPRVKYISGLYSVPFSSQWNANGHFYPIQIAQFGLSHFNKFLSYGEPKFIYLNVDKFMKGDLNDLKLNETDFKDVEVKPDRMDESNANGQLNIDQLTNDDLNQTSNGETNRRLLFQSSNKRMISVNDDESNQRSDQNKENEIANEPDDSNERTIYLNQTNLVFTLNLTKASSFYSSLFLAFKFKCIKQLRLTVVLMNEKRSKFKLNYRTVNHELFRNDNLVYGIGNSTEWRMFARDLGVDLIKSINLSRKKKSNNGLKLKNLHLYRLIFSGEAILKGIKLSSNGHFNQFVSAVNWFLIKQDSNGGWPSKVNKRLVSESLILNNNWYSSMAQGHAISLLVRAFHFRNEFNLVDQSSDDNEPKYDVSKNRTIGKPSKLINDELLRMRLKNTLSQQIISTSNQSAIDDYFVDDGLILNNSLIYLNAAISAVDLFKKNVSDNGISTYFMDKYRFYEEFPTTPSLFVLNGFVFSLFGLHDLRMTLDLLIRNQKLEQSLNDYYLNKLTEINHLFDEGVITLKSLLPLYDTGSSSLYDLRHFTLKVSVNIARWDYHSTHINLLLYLNTILNDRNIDDCAQRWSHYMKGKRADHN